MSGGTGGGAGGDRARDERAGGDRAGGDRARDERAGGDRAGGDRAGGGIDRELHELAVKQVALGEVRGAPAVDAVNVPMIRHWLDAMGDTNPVYLGRGLAPPAMAQVWTMQGVRKTVKERSPVDDMITALDAGGFTGVVATNCEQTYHRYARLGERLTPATRFTGLAGPKRTALGDGYFATWNMTWYAESGEPVAEMLFRVLKFRPPKPAEPAKPAAVAEPAAVPAMAAEPAAVPAVPATAVEPAATSAVPDKPAVPAVPERRGRYPLQPAVNRDTAFFWEGVRHGELRVQSCADCGELRHPPGPMCPHCRSTSRAHVVAAGVGTVYSYVVHHHPPVPGREPPFVVAVVALPEGIRIVGNIVDCPPEAVVVGMPVRVTYQEMDDELVLPMWTPSGP